MQSAWKAKLELRYANQGDRTLLSHRHFGPLRVQRPFFPEGQVNHTYLIHPPGGVVGNDSLAIEGDIGKDAHALITTPGATKVYRNVRETSVIAHHFNVRGCLEWLPQEIILFDSSRLISETTFNLDSDAKLVAWEVQCLGRPIGDLPYKVGKARLITRVGIDNRPAFQDNLVLSGQSPFMQAPWGLNGASALGVMLAYPAATSLLKSTRSQLENSPVSVAATLLDDILVVRAIANQAKEIRRVFVTIWHDLRPQLLNRMACPPRIWAT